MEKNEILEASRKENKNKDLVEIEAIRHAGNLASAVCVLLCFVLSLLASTLAGTILYSPWVIYFSTVGTNWCVRAAKLKRKSDWCVAVMFILLAVLALVGFVLRLLEVAV